MHLIDLTLTVSEKLPTFPGSPKPYFIPWETISANGYNLELLLLSSHTGTHIDSPFHFLQNGKKIHQIPLSRLVKNSILIKLKKSTNQIITKNDIVTFEKKFFKIERNSNVIFQTDWSKKLASPRYFKTNPGLSIEAAKYLVSKKVNLVGIDSPSIDLGKEKNFPVHHLFSKNDILILENLTNLHKIKKHKFMLMVLPLKLKGATGSPVRAVAFQVTN